jgi:hypothetical protein
MSTKKPKIAAKPSRPATPQGDEGKEKEEQLPVTNQSKPNDQPSDKYYKVKNEEMEERELSLYAARSSSMTLPFLLGEANYSQWAKALQAIFVDQGSWTVVVKPVPGAKSARSVISAVNEWQEHGEESSSSSSSSVASARKLEMMANRTFSQLLVAISKCPEAQSIVNDVPQGNPHELWKRLADHYEAHHEVSKPLLLDEFARLKMKKQEQVALYAARLRKVVMSLEAVGIPLDSTLIVHKLVSGLESPKFDMARRMLDGLNSTTKMTFETVCAYLRTQEMQLAAETKSKPVAAANIAQVSKGSKNQSQGGKKNVECFNCHQRGHYKSDCPKGRKDGGGKSQASNGKVCSYCGLDGHEIKECRVKARAESRAATGANSSSSSSSTKASASLGVQVANDRGVAGCGFVAIEAVKTPAALPAAVRALTSSLKSVAKELAPSTMQSLGVELEDQSWHLDSGAARHNAPAGVPLENAVVNRDVRIRVASGELLNSPVQGDLMLHTPLADRPLHLRSVLTHEKMNSRLLSVYQICASPIVAGIWFDAEGGKVFTHEGEVLLQAPQQDGVYKVGYCRHEEQSPETVAAEASHSTELPLTESKKVALWHARLAHLGVTGMARAASAKAVEGLEEIEHLLRPGSSSLALPEVCGGCAQGKAHRAPLGKGTVPQWVKAREPMDRWHVDSFGPFPRSLGGNQYLLLITDEASDKTFGAPTRTKADEAGEMQAIYRRAKTEHGKPLKEIHSDGGGEFRSQVLLDFWATEGTKVTTTMPHTPQHNARAERKGRTILEGTRSLMHHTREAPVELWAEAAKCVVYVRNLIGVRAGETETPNQKWHPNKDAKMKEKVAHLRTWGCDAWVHVPQADRSKLEPKAVICIFLGYEEGAIGYRFYDVERGRIVKSRDATFDDAKFIQCAKLRQYLTARDDLPGASPVGAQSYEQYIDEIFFQGSLRMGEILSAGEQHAAGDDHGQEMGDAPAPASKAQRSLERAPMFDILEEDYEDEESAYEPSHPGTPPAQRVQPVREKQRTNFYGRIDLNDVAAEAAETESGRTGLPPDPTTLEEMRRAPDAEKFEEAIAKEHQSLLEKEVMEEVDEVPAGHKALPTKYVLKRKLNVLGEVDSHKGRLVVKGMLQRPGLDYDEEELYAPTLHSTSLRVALAAAVQLDYEIVQMDVKTAFLNATLKEEIYITLPRGAKDALKANGKPRVFRLKKALYGLKQAPKEWNEEFNNTLTQVCGFKRLVTDSCLYVRKSSTGRSIFAAVFVDDTIVAFHKDDEKEATEIKNKIKSKYDVSDGGECNFILGMRIQRDRVAGSLTIDQQSYIERLLEKTGMERCVPVSTPEQPGVRLVSLGCVSSHDSTREQLDTPMRATQMNELTAEMKIRYQSVVGGLLYAAVWTRPDIGHAVGELTRFVSNPREAHWIACLRVLRYLKSCPGLGLTYCRENLAAEGSGSPITLGPVFADASHGGDPETRRSTTGVVVKLNGCVVGWMSRRQKSVALSSTEAEYLALGEASKEVMWLRQMLMEMGHEQQAPTMILGDNAGSLRVAYNKTHQSRMKYIDIRHHIIRDHVEQKNIELSWIPTLQQQADILTKGLGRILFNGLRAKVMGVEGTTTEPESHHDQLQPNPEPHQPRIRSALNSTTLPSVRHLKDSSWLLCTSTHH